MVDVEIDDSGLDAEGEDTRNSLIILVSCQIRKAPSTRDTTKESDVRPCHVMDEQQD
jgi:hypothetical protein